MRFSDWTKGEDLGRATPMTTVVFYLSSAGEECWCFPRVPWGGSIHGWASQHARALHLWRAKHTGVWEGAQAEHSESITKHKTFLFPTTEVDVTQFTPKSQTCDQFFLARVEFDVGVSFMLKATIQSKVDKNETVTQAGYLKTGSMLLGKVVSQCVRDHCSTKVTLYALSTMLTLLGGQKN